MKPELRVFVYGSLKTGFPGHEAYCAGALQICPAWRRGRLFKLTPQFPAMSVPDEDVLLRGTANAAADIEAQEKFESLLRSQGAGAPASSAGPGRGKVRGELLAFDDPESRLPLPDGFEEFRPGHRSAYIRVLVYVNLADGPQTSAWTYIAGFDPAALEEYAGENWEP